MSSNEVPGSISAWRKIKAIADRITSPHADKIYVAKDYTKADLRRDLLATIPDGVLVDDHSSETCKAKFDNLGRFEGFPGWSADIAARMVFSSARSQAEYVSAHLKQIQTASHC